MKGFLGVSPAFCHDPKLWYDTYVATEYSFVIPHDMQTLVDLMGGSETFEARLDLMVRTIILLHIVHFCIGTSKLMA